MNTKTSKKTSRIIKDNIFKFFIYFAAAITIFVLVWIIGYIIFRGIGNLTPQFFLGTGGIMPMIITTLMIVGLSLVISIPIGVLAALYLNEFAKQGKLTGAIGFCIESLAGIPSIIYGLFGMIFFVIFLKLSYSILAGALTLSIMVLPILIRTTEESLKTVPASYREGSLALGASKMRTTLVVVLPNAIPGILTGIILSIGRIVGESAAIYLTAGMVPDMPEGIMSSGRTLSVHMFLLAKEGISFDDAFATATILVVLVIIINFAANKIASSLIKK